MARVQTRRNVSIRESMYTALAARAAAERRSLSGIVEQLVNTELDALAAPPRAPVTLKLQECSRCHATTHNRATCTAVSLRPHVAELIAAGEALVEQIRQYNAVAREVWCGGSRGVPLTLDEIAAMRKQHRDLRRVAEGGDR